MKYVVVLGGIRLTLEEQTSKFLILESAHDLIMETQYRPTIVNPIPILSGNLAPAGPKQFLSPSCNNVSNRTAGRLHTIKLPLQISWPVDVNRAPEHRAAGCTPG